LDIHDVGLLAKDCTIATDRVHAVGRKARHGQQNVRAAGIRRDDRTDLDPANTIAILPTNADRFVLGVAAQRDVHDFPALRGVVRINDLDARRDLEVHCAGGAS
jgi:hypothetical protein